MFVKCVSQFGDTMPGDVVEVPDGAEVSGQWFVPVDPPADEPVTPPVVA